MPANTQRLEILNGWNEIGNYIGRGVRTVQRYERELGLPVRRPAGKSSGSVVATKSELDGWINVSPVREVFQLSHLKVAKSSPVHEFHRHIEEMHRLREEAAELRAELRVSLEALRASIGALSLQQPLPSSPERRLLADVLGVDPSKTKMH